MGCPTAAENRRRTTAEIPDRVTINTVSSDTSRRREAESLLAWLTRLDPFWAAQLVLVAAIALGFALSDKLTIGPSWLVAGLEALATIGLIWPRPTPGSATHPYAGIWHSPSRGS